MDGHHKQPQSQQSPGKDLNFAHPKNKAAALSTIPCHLLVVKVTGNTVGERIETSKRLKTLWKKQKILILM
jgi:hypothetical protein